MKGVRGCNFPIDRFLALSALIAVLAAAPVIAQSSPAAAPQSDDAEALAKKLNNPISDLVSVPFQFNWAQPVGPDDDTRFLLNVQPVMPFPMTKDWNLIARVIVPFIGQPPLSPGGAAESGIGDILTSIFFSPKEGKVIWGVGPVVSFPSTSVPTLGSGKWSIGPTAVVLQQKGRWTYGALVNQIWSFAGNENRADVSQAYFQPFLAYTTSHAVTYGVNSETTANWKADGGQKWSIPINFLWSKVAKFGPFPASYQLGAGYYLESPDGGPDWQLRATITLLLPRRG